METAMQAGRADGEYGPGLLITGDYQRIPIEEEVRKHGHPKKLKAIGGKGHTRLRRILVRVQGVAIGA
jgi:hypothetical protein